MIVTKEDLQDYLRKDKFALGKDYKRPKLLRDHIWRFQVVLRKHEYYFNNREKSLYFYLMEKVYSLRHQRLGVLCGFDIPCNVFGPGLRINHYG